MIARCRIGRHGDGERHDHGLTGGHGDRRLDLDPRSGIHRFLVRREHVEASGRGEVSVGGGDRERHVRFPEIADGEVLGDQASGVGLEFHPGAAVLSGRIGRAHRPGDRCAVVRRRRRGSRHQENSHDRRHCGERGPQPGRAPGRRPRAACMARREAGGRVRRCVSHDAGPSWLRGTGPRSEEHRSRPRAQGRDLC